MKQEVLIRAGFDYSGTMERFMGNAALYEKFLLRFPGEPTFSELQSCMKEEDYPGAERKAHTLKGVALNLGILPVGNAAAELVTALREGREEEYLPLCKKLEAAYRSAVKAIEEGGS